jgi:hypothetical protein
MATPNLTTDCPLALAEFPIETKEKPCSRLFLFEDGGSQSFYFSANTIQVIKLRYGGLSSAAFAQLAAFIRARKGCFEKFYFNDPGTGETDIPVKLDEDGWSYSFETPMVRSATVQLQRVL